MNIRWSRLATGLFVVAALVLVSSTGWAIFNGLGPSKDEWKLKYNVEVTAVDSTTLNVVFTLADEGRLKPIYSIDLIAFSKPDSQGGRTYDLKAPIKLQPTQEGKRAGQAQIRRELADRALFRILTLTVDGQKQRFAAYYDIPLNKYLDKAPAAATAQRPSSGGTPSKSKATK